MTNFIFTLQPTFTQGLILGQLSIIVLLFFVLKFLFFEPTVHPFETVSYQPRAESTRKPFNNDALPSPKPEDILEGGPESTEWFSALIQQVVDVYRSKLRGDKVASEGDEIARKKIEDFANRIRPVGFMDVVTIHSVDLGASAPRLSSARLREPVPPSASNYGAEFEVTYMDSISLSLSTSYLFNYPMSSFARLPVSLTISLSKFHSTMVITPPSPSSSTPVVEITIPPDFTLELSTTSLMGSRAKLSNVPKLHELIQHQVRRIFAARATWKVVLPGLTTIAQVQKEIQREMKEEH